MKRITLYTFGMLAALALIITVWEQVRPGFVHLFESPTVEAHQYVEPATDFELYVASKEVQDELHLMFLKKQRKDLDDQIAAQEGFL